MKIRILTALALAGALAACSDEASSTTAPLAPSPVPDTAAGFSDSVAIEPTTPPDVADTEGVVRNARMDATIAKPVIAQLSRVSNSELSVLFAVSSDSNINDYRIQWAPGCISGYNRKLGAESIFRTASGTGPHLVGFSPASPPLTHRAFKVRMRARRANNTATHRKGGPWSDEVLLYPGNPANTDPDQPPCTVGLTSTGADYCPLIVDGLSAEWEINAALRAELDPGGSVSRIREAHADGAVIEHRGFRAEARTSPDRWVIVSLDQEWRDYC